MKFIRTFLFLFLVTLFTACTGYGEKLEFDGTEVYYLDSVTKEEATQLGEFLVEGEFADDNRKSVQFSRDSHFNNLVFKMVVNPDIVDDPSYEYIFKTFTTELMEEFGQTVDFHLANSVFETIKVYKGEEQSKMLMALKTQILYTPKVKKETAQKLADYLVESDFSNDSDEKTIKLDRENDIYLFKMVVNPMILNDQSKQNIIRAFGELLESKVFPNDSLRVQLCNNRLEVQKDLY